MERQGHKKTFGLIHKLGGVIATDSDSIPILEKGESKISTTLMKSAAQGWIVSPALESFNQLIENIQRWEALEEQFSLNQSVGSRMKAFFKIRDESLYIRKNLIELWEGYDVNVITSNLQVSLKKIQNIVHDLTQELEHSKTIQSIEIKVPDVWDNESLSLLGSGLDKSSRLDV